MPEATLTAKQEEFARQYAAGDPDVQGNATAAAKAAGLTPSYGRRLIAKNHVKARITELRKAGEERAEKRIAEWTEQAVNGQEFLGHLARGEMPPGLWKAARGDEKVVCELLRSGTRAALHAIERVQGTVKQMHEWSIAKETRDAMIPVYVVGGPTADEDV